MEENKTKLMDKKGCMLCVIWENIIIIQYVIFNVK